MSSTVHKSYLRDIGDTPDTPSPFTLAEAVQNHNSGRREWNYTVAEFFDNFYRATEPEQRVAMLADEPPIPLVWRTDRPFHSEHVYVGGVTEWLSHRAGIPVPAWAEHPSRFSPEPIYPDDFGTPRSEEEKAKYRERSLPEFARRNDFVCDRLHERGIVRWIWAFDAEKTEERRQSNLLIAQIDRRANRVLWPILEDDHGLSKEEVSLRRAIAGDCLKLEPPRLTLEEALAKNGVSADDLNIDLSPVAPNRFILPRRTATTLAI